MTIAATTQSSLMAAHGVERPLQSLCVLSMIKWEIVHCLVRIDIVAKSVTAEQLAQVLMECLFTDLQLRGHQILATMRDGAAVNGAAMRIMQPFMPATIDVVCLSHTLDNGGNHFYTPVLDEFAQRWIRVFSCSCKAKLKWKEQMGHAIRTFSQTRWWSRWEVYEQMLLLFGDIRPFLDKNEDIAPKVMNDLWVTFNNIDCLCRLKIELAVVVNDGKHFVAATYYLEGDGAL